VAVAGADVIRRLVGALVLAVALAACSAHPFSSRPQAVPLRPAVVLPYPAAAPSALRAGVFEPGVPRSYAPVTKFTEETGVQPRIVLWYTGLERFPTAFARSVRAHGGEPFVQVNPGTIPMSAVAAGDYDAWVNAYARSVRAYGGPILISWAAEANGPWDSWGNGRTPAAVWIAAWRHVVTVFRQDGAVNAGFVWTVNAVNLRATAAPIRDWWPGSAYVTWAGIDGYYYRPADTWGTVFAATVAQVKAITSKPILISETAVDPSPSAPAQIEGLFANARRDHLAGVVWFDQSQYDPPYHDDWRLADDSAALAAYRFATEEAPR